jgi:hypothetical protein
MEMTFCIVFCGCIWLVRQWLLPRTWAGTNSVLSVYLVIKIRFIKYRFLKSMSRLRGRKRSTIAYTNNRLQCFLVQSCFIPRHLRHIIYTGYTVPTKLRYWIPWAWKGHVVPAKSNYVDSNTSAVHTCSDYIHDTWLKTKTITRCLTVILAYLRCVSTWFIAPCCTALPINFIQNSWSGASCSKLG